MWNLKSSVSAICRGDLGRECVLSQAHHHPVASSDSSSLPSCWRHFPRARTPCHRSSGYIWVVCLFPARSVLTMRARPRHVYWFLLSPLALPCPCCRPPPPSTQHTSHCTPFSGPLRACCEHMCQALLGNRPRLRGAPHSWWSAGPAVPRPGRPAPGFSGPVAASRGHSSLRCQSAQKPATQTPIW